MRRTALPAHGTNWNNLREELYAYLGNEIDWDHGASSFSARWR